MTIAAFAISTMPFAASTTSRPSGFAQRSSIARARAVDVEPDLAAEEVVGVRAGRARGWRRSRSARCRRGRSRPAPDRRPRSAARRAAARPSRPRRSSRRRRRSRPGRPPASGPGSREPRARRRPADGVPADLVVLRHRRPPVLDQADLGGGAAHVERDHVAVAERARPGDAAAITPAAGPDSTMNTGRCRAASEVNTPPLDCITSSFAVDARRREPLPRCASR